MQLVSVFAIYVVFFKLVDLYDNIWYFLTDKPVLTPEQVDVLGEALRNEMLQKGVCFFYGS